jgi:hypothetical protein
LQQKSESGVFLKSKNAKNWEFQCVWSNGQLAVVVFLYPEVKENLLAINKVHG